MHQIQLTKFRKKPVVIDAIQWTGENWREVYTWVETLEPVNSGISKNDGVISVDTREGVMRASVGDWIIRGVAGEFYPCKPEVFAATYEAA